MENDPIPFVKPDNSLLVHQKRDKIVGILVLKIRGFNNFEILKESLELLKFACLIVENLLHNRSYKDKIIVKDVIFLAFEKVFGNFNKDAVSNQIQFLYDNNQVIPSPTSKKIYKTIEHWFVRGKKRLSA